MRSRREDSNLRPPAWKLRKSFGPETSENLTIPPECRRQKRIVLSLRADGLSAARHRQARGTGPHLFIHAAMASPVTETLSKQGRVAPTGPVGTALLTGGLLV